MGYNTEGYSASGYNEDTENLTRYGQGDTFPLAFPFELTGSAPAGVDFGITVTENAAIKEQFGYDLGNAERDTVVIGAAEVD